MNAYWQKGCTIENFPAAANSSSSSSNKWCQRERGGVNSSIGSMAPKRALFTPKTTLPTCRTWHKASAPCWATLFHCKTVQKCYRKGENSRLKIPAHSRTHTYTQVSSQGPSMLLHFFAFLPAVHHPEMAVG